MTSSNTNLLLSHNKNPGKNAKSTGPLSTVGRQFDINLTNHYRDDSPTSVGMASSKTKVPVSGHLYPTPKIRACSYLGPIVPHPAFYYSV